MQDTRRRINVDQYHSMGDGEVAVEPRPGRMSIPGLGNAAIDLSGLFSA